MNNWKFDQPPNCAAITLRSIVFEGRPILHVVHDLEDHGWQFLGLEDVTEANIAVIAMSEIVELDPSIEEIAHIEPGYQAWRQSVESKWIVEEI